MRETHLKNIYITAIFGIIIALASCKKSTTTLDNDPVATATLRYLTQASWKQTTLEYQQQNGVWVSKPLSSATLAQITTFKTDGTYTTVSGSITGGGTYVIIGDNTQLALNYSITYNFAILNDTTMQLALTGQTPYLDPVTNVITTYYGVRQTYIH